MALSFVDQLTAKKSSENDALVKQKIQSFKQQIKQANPLERQAVIEEIANQALNLQSDCFFASRDAKRHNKPSDGFDHVIDEFQAFRDELN